jgi:hypothetical protein
VSRAEVLEKLIDLRRREGDEMARMHAAVDLGRLERAGLTVLPCSIHEFVARAGLLVIDPESPGAHEILARLLHGGEWWDDPTYQGRETLWRAYTREAYELLLVLRDVQDQERAVEAGG